MTKKQTLKDLLENQLLEKHRIFFKRLYAKGDLEKSLDEVISSMKPSSVKRAIEQCNKTIKDRPKWLAEWRDQRIDEILKDDDTL
jgi:hypothetical protein